MPVNTLLVEGKLDEELLGALLSGRPVVRGGSPKNSLAPRARDLRRDTASAVCYVRDRDFDAEPPVDRTQPAVDRANPDGSALGWHWCRHEIENYLLEPALVAASLGWDQPTWETEIVKAGQTIHDYQVARWTLGAIRRELPPEKEFYIRPQEFVGHDFRLPADLSAADTTRWAREQAELFRVRIINLLEPTQVEARLSARASQLSTGLLGDVNEVLVWCGGKDLLAALLPWMQTTYKLHPSEFRIQVRDWVIDNPDLALTHLPEWGKLRDLLRA